MCVCISVYEYLGKQAGEARVEDKEIYNLEMPANSAKLKFSKCTSPDPSEMVHMLPETPGG